MKQMTEENEQNQIIIEMQRYISLRYGPFHYNIRHIGSRASVFLKKTRSNKRKIVKDTLIGKYVLLRVIWC